MAIASRAYGNYTSLFVMGLLFKIFVTLMMVAKKNHINVNKNQFSNAGVKM